MELALPGKGIQDVELFPTACKILCYVLKKYVDGRERSCIQDFEADKLIRLLSKVWRELKKTRKQLIKLPLIDTGAKHGTRVAFPYGSSQKPLFALSGIKLLSDMGSEKSRTIRFHYEKWEHGTLQWITPLIADTEMFILLERRRIGSADFDLLKNFVETALKLKDKEVISLGRHENPEQTRESIKIEMTAWNEHAQGLIQEISVQDFTNIAEKVKKAEHTAWEAVSDANEMKKKAQEESSIYENGLKKIRELNEKFPELVSAFLSAQNSGKEIWKDTHVSSLAFPASLCFYYSNYVRGVLQNCAFLARDSKEQPVIAKEKATKKSFSNLEVLLAHDPAMRLSEFDDGVLEKLKQEGSAAPRVKIYKPEDIWTQKISFGIFAQSIEKAFNYIYIHYLEEVGITRLPRPTNEQLGLFEQL